MKRSNQLIGLLGLMFTMSLFVVGCGGDGDKNAPADSPIYGTWAFPNISPNIQMNGENLGPAMSFSMQITIQPSNQADVVTLITNTVTCSLEGQSAKSSVTTVASVTASKITALNSKQNTVVENGITCKASINKSEMGYRMDGANLVLSYNGQGEIKLTRVQ